MGVKTLNIGYTEKSDQNNNIFLKILKHLTVLIKIANLRNCTDTIVIYYNRYGIYEIILFILLRIKKIKIVVDIVEDSFTNAYKKNIIQKINQKTNNIIFKHLNIITDGIIVVSKSLQKKVTNYYPSKNHVLLIPASFDPTRFQKIKSYKTRKITFFYGGNYGEKDNMTNILKCFNQLSKSQKHARLVLTGIPDQKSYTEIKKNLLENKNILFKGYLSSKAYIAELNKSDIFLVPRQNTEYASAGFPFKLAEYMALGKPVLCSRLANIFDIIPTDSVLFYNTTSTNDLYRKMRYLYLNQSARHRIGVRAKITADKLFNRYSHAILLKHWLNNYIVKTH